MRHSWSVAVLLVLAAVAGYAAGTRPLQAQAEALPFNLGQTVELGFDASHSRKCRIEEMKGTFVRCRNLSSSDRATRWINIAQVAWMTTGVLSGEESGGR